MLFRFANDLRTVSVVLIVLSIFVLNGCGAGYSKTIVNGHEKRYYKDESGQKRLVYEVSASGDLIVHDESDPEAQRAIKGKQLAQEAAEERATRQERIKAATKRKPGETVFITLPKIKVGPELTKAQAKKGAVDAEIRKHFKNDKQFKIVSNKKIKQNQWAEIGKILGGRNPQAAPVADLNVETKAELEKFVGISKSTGKLGEGLKVVFEAEITSHYLDQKRIVREEANIFDNAGGAKRFATKIKVAIADDFLPNLPADRSL